MSGLHVYFQSDREPFRSWEQRPTLPYEHTYLREFRIGFGRRSVGVYRDLGRHLKRAHHDLLVAYGFSVATVQCVAHARSWRVPLVLACDATPETDVRSGLEFAYRKRLAASAAGCIAASTPAAEYFELLGVPRERISVVELTTDLQAIRDARIAGSHLQAMRNELGEGPIVTVVARLSPDKRILDACKAVLDAVQEIPSICLAIAGDGVLREEIQEWVTLHGESRIHLLGLLTWEQLIGLYRISDVMLFPATREKFGMVVIEALAAGVPVIAYNKSGAARDLIRNGENGFVVDEGDVLRMTQCLIQVLSDRGLLQRMKARAVEVVDTHDVRVTAKSFAAALEKARKSSVWSEPKSDPLRETAGSRL
jgi:glycosyltransferase involved in cell wall biosynthesis